MIHCYPPINLAWFEALIKQSLVISTEDELQKFTNEAYKTIGLINSALAGQQQLLTAIEALLIPPTTLPTLITWVAGMIAYLEEQYAPALKSVTQAAAIAVEVVALTEAIEQAASRLNATIVIPSVVPFCTIVV